MDKKDIQGNYIICNCLHSLESAIECTCFKGDDIWINFHWFEHFKNDFVEYSKEFNLKKAETSLFNMNVEAKGILEEIKKALEPAINIVKVLE